MSLFTFVVLCVQACLIQTVISQQCYGPNVNLNNFGYNQVNSGLGGAALGGAALGSVSASSCGQYGGVGTGSVGVAGDVGASGSTVVVGSVPVLGAVDFSGIVPACGSVSISGQCGCGCNA